MFQGIIIEIVAVLIGAGTSGTLSSMLWKAIRKKYLDNDGVDDLASKIEKASEHLVTASDELTNLQEELSARLRLVNKLKEEAKLSEQIISLNKDQVEAIRISLNTELKRDSRRNFWISFFIGFFFFILGAIASYIIPKLF